MPYDHDYVCMMKQPVLCELCNKSYAIGVMKKHKQSKMHIENAKNHGVPSSWWFVGGKNQMHWVGLRNGQMGGFKEWVDGWVCKS